MPRFALLMLFVLPCCVFGQAKPEYIRKQTRAATAVATLSTAGVPTLEGQWYYAGPFDNTNKTGFETRFAPEVKFDLKDTFSGKAGLQFGWVEYKKFQLGEVLNLKQLCPKNEFDSTIYLAHQFESNTDVKLPVSLGSDDNIVVWLNGKELLREAHERAAAADQDFTVLPIMKGKNTLLIKITQLQGGWEAYVCPLLPETISKDIRDKFSKDFPIKASTSSTPINLGAESEFYGITTFATPKDCVLEVGGLAFRPDGKLLACTRRGEVWLIDDPTTTTPSESQFSRYASGLHEALGLWVQDNKTVYVVQRPELSILKDTNGDNKADEFTTLCDKWGVSGDYHEYAFGPARDKDGNFFISLNVGFGGGHQSKAPWRGWCVKIDGKTGAMEPWAYGLRSPNGINFSPDGDLFYCDNQGEWVATNKMHHLQQGKFVGHQAGLRWVKDSPFAGKVSDKVASGMMYDGQAAPGKTAPKGMPELSPPCIWFPYGRMGKSASEPIWDTTGGKFGPFAGQCFVGDQNTAEVMRVALEKVNGVYQGACFPFRRGMQCGVNRLCFGPDGALYVGETRRGWGSLGGKEYGLQRISFSGKTPLEVHHIALTKQGFDITFTKPIDPALVKPDTVGMKSYTYIYASPYGCPETDTRPEKVKTAKLSTDGKTLSITGVELARGRVYDFSFVGVKSKEGESLLHADAYYTLNELVK
jgi:SMP-30/Gluconolactonase/LRE-like region